MITLNYVHMEPVFKIFGSCSTAISSHNHFLLIFHNKAVTLGRSCCSYCKYCNSVRQNTSLQTGKGRKKKKKRPLPRENRNINRGVLRWSLLHLKLESPKKENT